MHVSLTTSCVLSTDCQLLTDPDNGVISCSLGDDGQASLGDTCNYTCDSGYELSGNVNRSCELNGNWSGTEPTCTQSEKLLMLRNFYVYTNLQINQP